MIRISLTLICLGFLSGAAIAEDLTGPAKIVSGDVVEIGKTKVRLGAMDAPELEQNCSDARGERWACGIAARDELARHAGARVWTCRTSNPDRYGRPIGRCTVEGEDIGKWMVRAGWAVALVAFSKDYAEDEASAKSASAGIWAGAFIAPWDWRRRNAKSPALGSTAVSAEQYARLLRGVSDAKPPSPDCAIKGNINRAGVCIFHQPQGRWYAKIKMNRQKGNRWFCSVQEAELAGCRETRR